MCLYTVYIYICTYIRIDRTFDQNSGEVQNGFRSRMVSSIKIAICVLEAKTVEQGFWALIGRLFLGWRDMDCTWFVRNNLQELLVVLGGSRTNKDIHISHVRWFEGWTLPVWLITSWSTWQVAYPEYHCIVPEVPPCFVFFCCFGPLWGNKKTLRGIHVSFIFHWEGYFNPG